MSSGHDDFNSTGVRELPGRLPADERILWQGAPRWTSLYRRAFHGRTLSIYFAVLLVSRGIAVLSGGGSLAKAAVSMLWLAPLAVFALSMLALVAWLSARATWYTVTNKRVVMRLGVVLEITFNFPFTVIESAGLRLNAEGTGDIPLLFKSGENIAYLHLWPHARPWHYKRTQPMLRSIEEPQKVAEILSRALAAEIGGTTSSPMTKADAQGSQVSSSIMTAAGQH